jgi:uroporphyrinogen-III decarboxylase
MYIDWTVELGDVQNQIGDRVAIQGNLDPAVLYASPEVIETEVKKVLSQFNLFHINLQQILIIQYSEVKYYLFSITLGICFATVFNHCY